MCTVYLTDLGRGCNIGPVAIPTQELIPSRKKVKGMSMKNIFEYSMFLWFQGIFIL